MTAQQEIAQVQQTVQERQPARSTHLAKLRQTIETSMVQRTEFVFHDGGALSKAFARKGQVPTPFEASLQGVLERETQSLWDEKGEILPGREQDVKRMMVVAPEIIKAFISNDNLIRLAMDDHLTNLVQMGIQKGLRPETTIGIRTGFGGSDSEFTSERLPVYAVPALKLASAVDEIFERYVQTVRKDIDRKAVNRAYDDWLQNQNNQQLSRDEISAIKLRLSQDPSLLTRYLTPEERAAYEREVNIYNPQTVNVEFIFAQHAAAAANGTNSFEEKRRDPQLMYSPAIESRTAANIRAVQEFIRIHYREFANQDRVTFLEDQAWKEFIPHQNLVLEYLVGLLRKANDESVQKTLTALETTGQNHGGDKGRQNADRYAALHPFFFGDALHLPGVEDFFGAGISQPDFRVTPGGDPERHFDRMRAYLQGQATPEGFLAFLTTKQQELSEGRRTSERFAELRNVQDAIMATWKWQQQGGRKESQPSIALITTVGKRAVYYPTEFDHVLETLSSEVIQRRISSLETQLAEYAKPTRRGSDLTEEEKAESIANSAKLTTLKAVLEDYRALYSALSEKPR